MPIAQTLSWIVFIAVVLFAIRVKGESVFGLLFGSGGGISPLGSRLARRYNRKRLLDVFDKPVANKPAPVQTLANRWQTHNRQERDDNLSPYRLTFYTR
jgi:hypothetical protein